MFTKLSAATLARRPAASTMPGDMPGNKAGAATRRAILTALLEREPRTVNELAGVVGITHQGMGKHVRGMERDGLLTVERGMGRHGSQVRLTPAGRAAAKTV